MSKPRPWYETHPRHLWTAEDRRLAIRDGRKPPRGEVRRGLRDLLPKLDAEPLPPAPKGIFQGLESLEAREEGQRRRDADLALIKAGVKDTEPWVTNWARATRRD